MRFPELNPILHSQLRLAVISLLVQHREADFNMLRERTGASSGNLSVQLAKLKAAGYIEVIKTFHENYPQTICKILPEGEIAFGQYATNISSYTLPNKA